MNLECSIKIVELIYRLNSPLMHDNIDPANNTPHNCVLVQNQGSDNTTHPLRTRLSILRRV